MAEHPDFNWDAASFFERLTASNRLAQQNNFWFCRVSGLDGFEEALESMQIALAFVCVSDTSQGYTELHTSPHTRRVKTVYLAMRHAVNDMAAREECLDLLREIFRQFMSVLILEATKLEEHFVHIDPRITFNEIEQFFFSGCACASFQVAIDTYTDLRYNSDEWLPTDKP